jgi:D-sedoheptulose 7-phosphate isomerase
MSYINRYFDEAKTIIDQIDRFEIEKMIGLLLEIRERGGRLFFLGVGGSAGNASHAVNDFRKIAHFEAYSPVDNVSELTARTNDEGWQTVFVEWLKQSRLSDKDAVFVFSVGGGNKEKNISANLVYALEFAKTRGAAILGVVGRDGGYTAKVADACVVIPPITQETVTPHAESFQAVIWHLIVSHPQIMRMQNKWESVETVRI